MMQKELEEALVEPFSTTWNVPLEPRTAAQSPQLQRHSGWRLLQGELKSLGLGYIPKRQCVLTAASAISPQRRCPNNRLLCTYRHPSMYSLNRRKPRRLHAPGGTERRRISLYGQQRPELSPYVGRTGRRGSSVLGANNPLLQISRAALRSIVLRFLTATSASPLSPIVRAEAALKT